MGLELLAEAGNYAALQRLYGPSYSWPYPPQPTTAAAAAAAAAALGPAAASVDLYYRQAAAAAALQKPLAYRLYPPGLPLLPHMSSDPLRDALRPEALRPDTVRPDAVRPELLKPELRPDAARLERQDLLKGEAARLESRLFPLDGRLILSPSPRDHDEAELPFGDRGRPLGGVLRASESPSPTHCPSPTDLRVRASPDSPSDPHPAAP